MRACARAGNWALRRGTAVVLVLTPELALAQDAVPVVGTLVPFLWTRTRAASGSSSRAATSRSG